MNIPVPANVVAWLNSQNVNYNNPIPLPPTAADLHSFSSHAQLAAFTSGAPLGVVEELLRISFRLSAVPLYLQVGHGGAAGPGANQVNIALNGLRVAQASYQAKVDRLLVIEQNRALSKIDLDLLPVPMPDAANPQGPPLLQPVGQNIVPITNWADVRALNGATVNLWLNFYNLVIPPGTTVHQRKRYLFYSLGGSEAQVIRGD